MSGPAMPANTVESNSGKKAANVGRLWATLRARGGDLTWVVVGKGMLVGANAALLLFLAQRFEVETYGLMVTVIGAQTFVSRIALMGLDGGIIRLRSVADLRHHAAEVVSAGFWITAVITCLLAIVAFGAPKAVAQVAGRNWPDWVSAVVLIGAAGMALVDYTYAYRLSNLQYKIATLLQGGTSIVRMAATAAAAVMFPTQARVAFFAFAITSVASGAAQLRWMPFHANPDPRIVRRLISFSAWQGLSDMAVVLSLHQGTFLLMLMGQRVAAGVFGLALTMTLGFFAVNQALFQFVFPKMVRLERPSLFPAFAVKAIALGTALAAACVPAAYVLGAFLPRFLRPEYRDMGPVVYWLSGAMLLAIIQAPLLAGCLYLLKPNYALYSLAVRIVSTGLLGLLLIPSAGSLGAAMAQFGGGVLGSACLAGLVLLAMRSANRDRRLYLKGDLQQTETLAT